MTFRRGDPDTGFRGAAALFVGSSVDSWLAATPHTIDASPMSHRELPTPPVATATDPVQSAADLRQRWRALMGPLGFGEKLLWFAFVGPDRRLTKVLSQVPIGPRPQGRMLRKLMSALRTLLDDMASKTTVALLLTGPGGARSRPATGCGRSR
ncbi:hypothetical protein I552_5868 [Mycobacterium xenopi 3993]|nr:hypothetical protein I552_5868 [Mycobacterium xenopi 3993]